jgi:hypothetical protein
MNIKDYVILIILAALFIYTLVNIRRRKASGKGTGCCGSCSGCKMACSKNKIRS